MQPNKAIVGANAFAHESGIHQDGVLKSRETYEIMRAQDVGWSENRMVLGKHSGRNAFRARLKDLGIEFDVEEELNAAFFRFKDLADKKHEIFDEDLQALVTDTATEAENERVKLVSLKVCSETGETPKADLVIAVDGGEQAGTAFGSGPVDAVVQGHREHCRQRLGAPAVLGQQYHQWHRCPGRGHRTAGEGRAHRQWPRGGHRHRHRLRQGLSECGEQDPPASGAGPPSGRRRLSRDGDRARMDEQRRLEYLQAMGVQVWCRRGQGVATPVSETEADVPIAEAASQCGAVEASAPAVRSALAPHQPTGADHVGGLGWAQLRQQVVACRACGLHQTRTQTVFGVGAKDADLLIIGEAPGADEDRQGEPFVGRAGQLLNAMLLAIGLRREQVYIANILKCRPPGNRDPQAEEALRCWPFLQRQLELLAPKAILAVGRISAQNLLHTHETIGRLRGRVHRFGSSDTPLVATYHPAYLLRSPEQKARSWQDLQLLLGCLRGDVR